MLACILVNTLGEVGAILECNHLAYCEGVRCEGVCYESDALIAGLSGGRVPSASLTCQQ